jgi:hypothetical protein
MKNEHRRAFPAKNGPRGAPVLEFGFFLVTMTG